MATDHRSAALPGLFQRLHNLEAMCVLIFFIRSFIHSFKHGAVHCHHTTTHSSNMLTVLECISIDISSTVLERGWRGRVGGWEGGGGGDWSGGGRCLKHRKYACGDQTQTYQHSLRPPRGFCDDGSLLAWVVYLSSLFAGSSGSARLGTDHLMLFCSGVVHKRDVYICLYLFERFSCSLVCYCMKLKPEPWPLYCFVHVYIFWMLCICRYAMCFK